MTIPVDVWLRGTDVAQTTSFDGPVRPPAEWTDEDVQRVLGGMLRAMHRQKHPDADEGTIASAKPELDREPVRRGRRGDRDRDHARRRDRRPL